MSRSRRNSSRAEVRVPKMREKVRPVASEGSSGSVGSTHSVLLISQHDVLCGPSPPIEPTGKRIKHLQIIALGRNIRNLKRILLV